MAPVACGESTRQSLSSDYYSVLAYHPIAVNQNRCHGAWFCLGESPEFKCYDLCYSFKTMVRTEYGGLQELHQATWNYQNNWQSMIGNRSDYRMSYEKVLRNLVMFMFGHYIDAFECTGAQNGHWAILALECFMVANHLGQFHQWYKQTDLDKQPPREKSAKWKDMTDPPQNHVRPHFAYALALLGSPKEPSYGHPKVLGWYFNHIYHQG